MASKKAGKAKGGAEAPEKLDVAGSAAAVDQHRARAAALPSKEVRGLGGDPALAAHNVGVAIAALAPHRKAIGELPAPFSKAALAALPSLAAAVVHAHAQVDRSSTGDTKKDLARASAVRALLLNAAVTLADAKALPPAKVATIKKGSGPRDLAQDCVDLAALFRANAAAIKGKTAIGKDVVDEAATVGDALLALLKPKAGKGKPSAGVRSAVDDRDRLWTLLVQGYEAQARRAGMWIWVGEVDDHVPTLQARAARRPKKAAAAPDPGPAKPGG